MSVRPEAPHPSWMSFAAWAALSFLAALLADVLKLLHVVAVLPAQTPSLWVEAAWLGLRYLWPVAAYLALTVLAVGVLARGPKVASGLHAAGAVGLTLATYLILGAYEPFRTFWPAILALLVALAAMLTSFALWRRQGAAAPRRAAGLALLVSAILLVAADRWVYPGLYATMHLGLLVLLPVATFWSAVLLVGPPTRAWGRRALLAAGGGALISVLAAPVFHDQASGARAAVRALTVLGQAPQALSGETLIERGRVIALDTGPWAESYFAAHAGLPALPADFRLAAYDVLFISIEATRYDYTSFGDPKTNTTPNLRRFAESGAHWFTRAYSPSSGTLHSMSSIMTMDFPSSIRLNVRERAWWGHLASEELTVDELMRDDGRATFWASHDVGHVFSKGRIGGFGAGVDPAHLKLARNVPEADAEIVDFALSELRALTSAKRRYFGWVFLPAPHGPYEDWTEGKIAKSEKECYLSELRYMDTELGRLLAGLESTGALAHTIVVIAADHGEEFRDHGGERHKSTVFSEVTHVPLVAWIPGMRGGRHDAPTSLVYLFPWLLSHDQGDMRKKALQRIESSLVPMMRATNDAVVIELIGHDRMMSSLVYPQLKLNHNLFADHTQVFDLDRDPGEHRDLLLEADPRALTLAPHLQGYLDVRRTNQRFVAERLKK